MKKTALFLSLILSLATLTACGDDSSKSSESSKTEAYSSAAESVDSTSESSQLPESESSDEPSAEAAFERGTIDGSSYTSSFGSIKFTAPDGWTYANDEYIANMMNIGMDLVGKNDDLTKAMLEQTTIYDTICMEQTTGKNIIFMYENLAKEVPDPDQFTVDDYINMMESQFDSLQGVSYSKAGTPETVTLSGNEYTKVKYDAKYDAANITTSQIYYMRKQGNYIVGLIASSGKTTDDMSMYEANFLS